MVIAVLASFFISQAVDDNDITGVWVTQKQDSKIEISRSDDGTYTGKIIWADAPHKAYVGTVVMKGMTYDSQKGDYVCPWIYDPRLNVTAHALITLNGRTMKVKAIKGIISKQETFTRDCGAEPEQ